MDGVMSTVTQSPVLENSPARTRRRQWTDRQARRLVTLGGVAIIGSILAILFVIIAEFYPLFRSPKAIPGRNVVLGDVGQPMILGVDEYREIAYVVTEDGVSFLSMENGRAVAADRLEGLSGAKVMASSVARQGSLAVGLSDGRVLSIQVGFDVTYPDEGRLIRPVLKSAEPIHRNQEGRAVRLLDFVSSGENPTLVVSSEPRDITVLKLKEERTLTSKKLTPDSECRLQLLTEGYITTLVLDVRGEALYAGTSSGEVIAVDLLADGGPRALPPCHGTGHAGAEVSALCLLVGDRTLVVGGADGGVRTLQLLTANGGTPRLTMMGEFSSHARPVKFVAPCLRNKTFLTADDLGLVKLHFGTSGETLLDISKEGPGLRAITMAPKGDEVIAVGTNGRLLGWKLVNPHPEVSPRSIFGKTWYEGYPKPEYVWQSSGSTEDFESKLCLTPLIFGTLKGTFYALFMAVPIALLGALYASQFMHPSLRSVLKPTVEIMAALPSVVLGFIAGLWLAPIVEKIVPGILLLPFVVAVSGVIVALGHSRLPRRYRQKFKPGMEAFLLVPVVLLAGWIAFSLGGIVESNLLGGDFRTWLRGTLGLTYDQRNSLVVGIAMGFAVIPIIFTIAEDAISSVPAHLVAGSLALGATRWQTAVRVVLPTASPGIFSAIMIGFGRAVGETMIVLMATGNTPIMDWSIFNGFRALSANIAVELPEAPEGGTLYRVLFLSAFLLFVMTFVVNTAAEIIRLKLREKYRYV